MGSPNSIIDKDRINAGYHWFSEWGRNAMISLTGLTLCAGKRDIAFNILRKYSNYGKNGLLPNYLSKDNNHSYNSIDTSLLFGGQ
ncbi:MAG: amylo-alpha-1,6-glucosidase [Spirochaetota bacterium]|nr:amylo-alpha-1,6-glucosidase [Spirochaetota bacterium]